MSKALTVQENKIKTISNWLKNKGMQEIVKALPKQAGMEPSHFVRVAFTTIRNNQNLLQCTQDSLFAGLLRAAQCGLSLDPILGQAYLVPFKTEAQFIIGYRGLITMMTRSAEVKYVTAHIVYSKDKFKVVYGNEEYIEHEPYISQEEDKGHVVGAYAIAHMANGLKTFRFMSFPDLERIRKLSKTYDKKQKRNFGPWHDHLEAMYQKCPIRQLHKLLPIVPTLIPFHMAAAVDEAEELGIEDIPAIDMAAQKTESKAVELADKVSVLKEKTDKPSPAPEQGQSEPEDEEWTLENSLEKIFKITNTTDLRNWKKKYGEFLKKSFGNDFSIIRDALDKQEGLLSKESKQGELQ